MDEKGVRRLVCEKDHSHWREVSAQDDPWEKETKSATRCANFLMQIDPQKGYGSRGLHEVPTELRAATDALLRDDRWKFRCRR